MTNAELIAMLQQLPQDLSVRLSIDEPSILLDDDGDFNDENLWVIDVEYSNTGDSGYEIEGEIRLIVSE